MRLLRNRFYYSVKPWLSPGGRLFLRRWYTRRQRARTGDQWPILPGSECPPPNWPGWPKDKRFAVVLTHDVEGPQGLSRCRELMELEQELGFRSSFYFIPEGPYRLTEDLRDNLRQNGFEVGVHDLHHDGKLYSSYQGFLKKSARINRYLKEWDAVGFRSGFMLHNLEWAHQLNVLYEASTFDTDPFEPQPDGAATIFPFWVPRSGSASSSLKNGASCSDCSRSPAGGDSAGTLDGYVELPYTLAQDSTLFLLLGERQPDIWFQKLEWVARMGGMALVDTHPDYAAMNGTCSSWEYPVKLYRQFLEHLRTKYAGQYWQVTAAELATWYKGTLHLKSHHSIDKKGNGASKVACEEIRLNSSVATTHSEPSTKENGAYLARGSVRTVPQSRADKPKIWIDLDNTPHVPFFEPILEELRARGFPLLVTARDAFQVCDLADKKGLQYIKVGRHYGKHMLYKGAGLVYRALQLAPLVVRERPMLGVSHGARSQMLLGVLMGFPTVLIEDYEYCKFAPMAAPKWLMTPDVIPDSALQLKAVPVVKYPGIKEDVYAWKLRPDAGVLRGLGLRETDMIVTVRPPATEAHYHNPESEKLFEEVMDRVCKTPEARVVLLPRNHKQGEHIRISHPEWFQDAKTIIPGSALDGMNLIWHSDLVVSGGGTMNREAAALGVPVYSIFRGTIGAVDRHLQSKGQLVLLESRDDVHRKLKLVRKPRTAIGDVTSRRTLLFVVDAIEKIATQVQLGKS